MRYLHLLGEQKNNLSQVLAGKSSAVEAVLTKRSNRLPEASNSKCERMGMVVLHSTTPKRQRARKKYVLHGNLPLPIPYTLTTQ